LVIRRARPLLLRSSDLSSQIVLAILAATLVAHRVETIAHAAEQRRFGLFSFLIVVLSICLRYDPAAESLAKGHSHFRTPLVQRLPLDHISELLWRDAQSIDRFLELVKFLINDIHDILLALRGICQMLIVLIAAQVITVSENA